MHVSVFGLGRSGLAIAKAVIRMGGTVTVYDQASREGLAKPEALDAVRELGAEVVLDWNGVLPNPPAPHSILVVNPAVDMRNPILQSAKEQGYELISEIEFAFRISKAPIVAITGTNGKSTTTVMTYVCLTHCGVDAILCGNIFGSGYPEVPLTEAALNSNENQVLVAEISSFQLEWIKDFQPVSAGITNIWPDHLDRYDSFDQYVATKHRIFTAQTSSDFAIVRANDPVVHAPGTPTPVRRLRGRKVPIEETVGEFPTILSFGATGEHARIDDRFLSVLDKHVKLNELPFSEPHNHTNAAMAALLAYGALKSISSRWPDSRAATVIIKAQIEAEDQFAAKSNAYNQRALEANRPKHVLPQCILEALKSFGGLEHRMEIVGERNGVRVVNNSMCTNPDAVLKSATSLRGPNHVLIGGRNKDLDFRPLRHYFANGMHHAYVYGESRSILSEQIGTKLVYEKMEDAARAALEAAKSGEVVMLAPGCASTDQFRDFRHRGDVFRKLAKEWLES